MRTLPPSHANPTIKFEYLNWIGTDPLPRDQAHSLRLHAPEYLVDADAHRTGRDIEGVTSHPSLVDGTPTIYFDTEVRRTTYKAMPPDRPNRRLPYPG